MDKIINFQDQIVEFKIFSQLIFYQLHHTRMEGLEKLY